MTMSLEHIGQLLAKPGAAPIVWSPEQREAITVAPRPHLIVAGAGSGKTTVMTARILWLIGQGLIQPQQALGLTFTNKAAGEFSERLIAALSRLHATGSFEHLALAEDGSDVGEPGVSTYHSFAQSLLAEHGLRIGYEPGATLLNDVTRQQLAYRTVRRSKIDLRHISLHIPTVVSQVLELDGLLAERLIEPQALLDDDDVRATWLASFATLQKAGQEMLATSYRRQELAQLVTEFREAKQANLVADFSDQMRYAAGLALELAASAPEVVAALREKFPAVLLDEYQDTSVSQRRMLQALFGDGHMVMAVGDPCQAIYGWRGASVFNIDEFIHDFPQRDGSPASYSTLSEVRRCAPEILQVANELSEPLRTQHPMVRELRSPAGPQHQGRFELARSLTVADEVNWVVERIAIAMRDIHPAEIAVLCRTRADIGVMAAALDTRGIAYEVVGVTGLLSRPEIADVLAVLRVLHNPADNPALVRILASTRWALGVRDLAALGAYAAGAGQRDTELTDASLEDKLRDAVRDQDPADVLALCDVVSDIAHGESIPGLSHEGHLRCRALDEELKRLRRGLGDSIADVISRIVAVTGIGVEIRLGAEALVTTRVHALDELVQLADDYVGLDGDLSLSGFLQWLHDAQEFDKAPNIDLPSTGTAVRLMTVHASKGLEFDAVVLPFLVAGTFPAARGRPRWPTSPVALPPALLEDRERPHMYPQYPDTNAGPRAKDKDAFDEHMKALTLIEERRLAYVAITRARKLVIASGHLWGATQKKVRQPSPWLDAIHTYLDSGGAGEVSEWVEYGAESETRPQSPTPIFAWPVDVSAHERELLLQSVRRVDIARARANASVDVRESNNHVGAENHSTIPPTPAHHSDSELSSHNGADEDIAGWIADTDTLIAEWNSVCTAHREVALPSDLSTTDVIRLHRDPDGFARRLARPMPLVSSTAAARGTSLHAYIEYKWRGELALFADSDVDQLAAAAVDDPDVRELIDAYEAGEFGQRAPSDVEVEFTLVVGSRTLKGRIDAVFAQPDGTWLVVDWKTSRAETESPVQLAIYRLAWAHLRGIDPAKVTASFHYVRTGNTVSPDQALMSAEELRTLIEGEPPVSPSA